MTLKTHTIKKKNSKHNQEWSWEETPELLAAIEQLKKTDQRLKEIRVPTLHFPNTTFAPPKRRKND